MSETAVSGVPDESTSTIHSTSTTEKLVTISVPCTECSATSTQWTTSTLYTTSASIDSTGGTVIVTVPHTTTVSSQF